MLIMTLLLQAIVVPMLLAGLAVRLCIWQPRLRNSAAGIFLGIWLLAYIWIVNTPNFPPRMTTDWLWIIVAALLIGDFLSRCKISSMHSLTVLLLVSAGILLWPILSYHPSLSKHGLLWLELTIFTIVACLIISQTKTNATANQPLGLVVLSGITGVLTLTSGSMLLGLLSLSLASSHVIPALFKQLALIKNVSFFVFITLILLLLSRHYTALNLASFLALLLANLIAVNTVLSKKLTIGLYSLLIAISSSIVIQQEILATHRLY